MSDETPTTCWLCGASHGHGAYHLDGCPHCSSSCTLVDFEQRHYGGRTADGQEKP